MKENRSLGPRTLLQQLRWRYAVKQFDPARKISDAIWQALEAALVLTPSSYGLQPWQFLVITNQAIKEALVEHSWKQRQVADCSHAVVFAVPRDITEKTVDRYINQTAAVRKVEIDSLAVFRKMMVSDLVEGPRSQAIVDWAKLQVYIALGNFLTCAALLEVDTCPMEGFIPEQYDAVLGLAEKNLTAAVVCAAGYRSKDDRCATLPKVRFPREDMITYYR